MKKKPHMKNLQICVLKSFCKVVKFKRNGNMESNGIVPRWYMVFKKWIMNMGNERGQ